MTPDLRDTMSDITGFIACVYDASRRSRYGMCRLYMRSQNHFPSFQCSTAIFFNTLWPDILNIPATILTTATRYTHIITEEARLQTALRKLNR